jgi:hypothetical protein
MRRSARSAVFAALAAATFAGVAAWSPSSSAAPFFFSTGNTDGKMAGLSQPGSPGKLETENADDFILNNETILTNATFTGLLTGGATLGDISQVRVEIYRVFPLDSANPPSGNVPTRANSPSDVEFLDRDTASANLSFSAVDLGTFLAANSVVNGIHPKPNQTTGGDGAVRGTEVEFNVNFLTPIDLPADHYFFVPQVGVNTPNGGFLWLSAPKPIVPPGTPFLPDLQAWIRNANLDPDWLRIGTDIVGGQPAPTFNMTFSLTGFDAVNGGGGGVPLPSPLEAMLVTVGVLGTVSRAARRRCEFNVG